MNTQRKSKIILLLPPTRSQFLNVTWKLFPKKVFRFAMKNLEQLCRFFMERLSYLGTSLCVVALPALCSSLSIAPKLAFFGLCPEVSGIFI